MSKAGAPKASHPLGLARFLSWSSFVVIILLSLLLSLVIANSAKQTLLRKQQQFALLLAENLNHQIYRRFTLPTLIGFGYVELKQKAQYERLDQIVTSTVHGLHVGELLIFSTDGSVSYATKSSLVGRADLAGTAVRRAIEEGEVSFEITSRTPLILALFHWKLEPDTVTLKTTFPLRIERSLAVRGDSSEPIMGVLQVTQDITEDYKSVIRFQWVVIVATVTSCLLMFFILLTIIRRADRVLAERMAEKERLERDLHQSEALASMGRVVASIAHEIRNPLGIIRSSAELLLKRAQNQDDAQVRIIQAVYDEAKRLSRTVNEFLDYARPKQPRQDPVDLAQVLDQALVFLDQDLSRRGIAVERRYLEGLEVLGDKDLLYRALYNVLTNALQAVDQSGTIRVESESLGDEVVLTVSDSGPGFEEASLDKMLDPFFTTKAQGTGLGLAIVNSIVQSHGGGLTLSNRPEGGAAVELRFPKAGLRPSGA